MADLARWLSLIRRWDDAEDPREHLLVFADVLADACDWREEAVRGQANRLNEANGADVFRLRRDCRLQILALFARQPGLVPAVRRR